MNALSVKKTIVIVFILVLSIFLIAWGPGGKGTIKGHPRQATESLYDGGAVTSAPALQNSSWQAADEPALVLPTPTLGYQMACGFLTDEECEYIKARATWEASDSYPAPIDPEPAATLFIPSPYPAP